MCNDVPSTAALLSTHYSNEYRCDFDAYMKRSIITPCVTVLLTCVRVFKTTSHVNTSSDQKRKGAWAGRSSANCSVCVVFHQESGSRWHPSNRSSPAVLSRQMLHTCFEYGSCINLNVPAIFFTTPCGASQYQHVFVFLHSVMIVFINALLLPRSFLLPVSCFRYAARTWSGSRIRLHVLQTDCSTFVVCVK